MLYPSSKLNAVFDATRLPEGWNMLYEAAPHATHPTQIYPLSAHTKKFQMDWETYGKAYIKKELTLLSIPASACGDEETPPIYPIYYLVAAAINGSPERILTTMEIRLALLRRFPYFARDLSKKAKWLDDVDNVLSANFGGLFKITRRSRKNTDDTSVRKYSLLKVPSPAAESSRYKSFIENLASLVQEIKSFNIQSGRSIYSDVFPAPLASLVKEVDSFDMQSGSTASNIFPATKHVYVRLGDPKSPTYFLLTKWLWDLVFTMARLKWS